MSKTKNSDQITITNPWSGATKIVTRGQVKKHLHDTMQTIDAWHMLRTPEYRNEAREGYSAQDGTISAWMYS